MIQLILVLCLSASPNQCIEDRLLAEPPFTAPIGCMVAGQRAREEAERLHPGYVLRRWRCEVGKREERAA